MQRNHKDWFDDTRPEQLQSDESPIAALQALRSHKLRILWDGPRPPELTEERLLLPLWMILRRWKPEPPGICQDERVVLKLVESGAFGFCVHFLAIFDHDFCSQYDRTEELEGEFVVD